MTLEEMNELLQSLIDEEKLLQTRFDVANNMLVLSRQSSLPDAKRIFAEAKVLFQEAVCLHEDWCERIKYAKIACDPSKASDITS